MDVFSVPQVTPEVAEAERASVMEDQQRAIWSIPSYIEQSAYFYVCCPTAKHENGRTCSFSSWRGRGWCRMEEAVNFLSPEKPGIPIILTEAPKVRLVDLFDFFLFRGSRAECSVFNGDFTC